MKHIVLLILFMIAFCRADAKKQVDRKPNIILFYVDDLGWMDLGCQGSEYYETPEIDKLATQGMRFTNAYTCHPRCVPARYGVITGKFPARGKVPGEGELRPADFTLAEALKLGGYKTFFTGKWHLLFQEGLENMPEKQGFDINVAGGAAGSPPTYWFPYRKDESSTEGQLGLLKTEIHGLDKGGTEGEYITDRLTSESVSFIEKQTQDNPDQPFFLYLSHYGVHTPFEGKPELVSKYEAKLKTMKYNLPEYIKTQNGDTKLRQDFPVYAAMIESVDQSMGRITETLSRLGIDDNTIIIFTADNGGLSSRGNRRTLATSNYPLKNGKGWLNEGGIREAFIVKWPGVAEAGSLSDAQTISTDIYPTVLEMADQTLRPQDHMDGESIVSAIRGESFNRTKIMFWHSPAARPESTGDENSSAIRSGDYKLIHWYDEDKLELFNLKDDLGENHNLANEMPEKTSELLQKLSTLKTEVLNWQPATNDDKYDFSNFPYIDGFESDIYKQGMFISGFDGKENDSWLQTSPRVIDRFWRGKGTLNYTCMVSDDAFNGNNAIKIAIQTKPGESSLKLRTVNIPEGSYQISFFAKTDGVGVGRAKIGFSANSADMLLLSAKYTRYEGIGTVKKNDNGTTRLMIVYLSDAKESNSQNYNIFIDDLTIEQIQSSKMRKVAIDGVKVHPNPTSKLLHVNGLRSGDKLKIMDLKGRILFVQNEAKSHIDVGFLNPGAYLLALSRDMSAKTLLFSKI